MKHTPWVPVEQLEFAHSTVVSGDNSQRTTIKVLKKRKGKSSDSLTTRAIQAYMDTEEEWAEVYANLADS